jgi:Sulfite exporter TauE/SafE
VFLHYKNKQKQTAPENAKKENEEEEEYPTSAPAAAGLAAASPATFDDENGNRSVDANSTAIPMSNTTATNFNSNGSLEKKAAQDSSDWPLRRLLCIYILVIFVGMIAGMVGLGGGVLIAPLMMELGVHPQSAAATSTLVVLFSSTIASVTFGLYGRINLSYFAVYGPVCFVGGLVGVFILSGLVRRYNMASLITLLLGTLVVVSAGLVAGFAMREAIEGVINNGGSIQAAAQFCSG